MNKSIILLLFFGLLIGCKNDDDNSVNPTPKEFKDADFYSMAKPTTGFVYYKNSSDLVARASGSGHTQPFLSTRYNAKAAGQLDAQFKVKSSASFPDSSFIVKELRNADSSIAVYAFMYKLKGHPNADANGWIWGEANVNGTVGYSITKNGEGCIGCHSAGVDYTRMNDSHP